MRNLFDIKDDELTCSVIKLRDAFLARNWPKADIIFGGTKFLFVTRPDGKSFRFVSTMPPTTNAFAFRMANDKIATYHFLNDFGILQPYTCLLSDNSEERDTQILDTLSKYNPVVIKPLDGAHGNGVTVNVSSLDESKVAFQKAIKKSPSGKVLVQEQVFTEQPELRVICIDYKVVGAYWRIPAFVTGDGKRNIEELIAFENSTKRTAPYKSNLGFIMEEDALLYLKKIGVDTKMVLRDGETMRVSGTCNIGKGGIVKNAIDEISDDFKKTAESIAKEIRLPVVGIDFCGDYLLEVNATPELYYPTNDESSMTCIEKFVDYLEQI